MCYCCRKLDFQRNLSKSASHGLSDPVSSHLIGRSDLGLYDRSVLSNQMTGNRVRESVGGRGSPNSDSLTHSLSPQNHVISDSHGLSISKAFIAFIADNDQMCPKSLTSCFYIYKCTDVSPTFYQNNNNNTLLSSSI